MKKIFAALCGASVLLTLPLTVFGGTDGAAVMLRYYRYRSHGGPGDLVFGIAIIVGAIVIGLIKSVMSDRSFNTWRNGVGRSAKQLPRPSSAPAAGEDRILRFDRPQYVTVASVQWFIRNNTNTISQWVRMFSPGFDQRTFMPFVKNVFAAFAKLQDPAQMGGRVAFDVKATLLPGPGARFGDCFMHNYILTNGYENIKVLITVYDRTAYENGGAVKYFATFSKKNPLIGVVDGQFLTIECPNCGGRIEMRENSTSKCPFCGGTVLFAESDWIMTQLELVTEETLICNDAVIKSY